MKPEIQKSSLQVNRKKSRRGSALVEASLIFLLGGGLMVGSFDIAQMLFMHQTVVDRTRAAARYGSVNAYDSGKIRNMVLFGTPTVGNPAPPTGLFGMNASNVTITRVNANTWDDRLNITVTGYSYPLFSAVLVNGFYKLNSGSSGGTQSNLNAWQTGLTTKVSVPYEYIP
jgi:hypothetical protein